MRYALRSSLLALTFLAGQAVATTQSLGIVSRFHEGTVANDMNAAGQVAGVIEDHQGGMHAMYFDHGKLIELDTLGGTESEAAHINDKGQVIGSSNKKDGTWTAFLYSRADGMRQLGTLGGASSHGTAINDAGDAIGFADTENGDWHAFVYRRGEPLKDLGTFGGKVSYASGINKLGQVVGTATTADQSRHAFFYDAARGMVDLGTLGGRFSMATAINDKGVVVGTSEMPDRQWHAFVYDGQRMTDLGALIGRGDSFATGINNAGHVVGTVQVGYQQRLSFVWRDQQMLLHPAGKGLYLTNAINDNEQVIGATYDRGLKAATMASNTVPFRDVGGIKLITLITIALMTASAAVIYRKRYRGLSFRGFAL